MNNQDVIKSALKKVKKAKGEDFGFQRVFDVEENYEVTQALEKQIPKKPYMISDGYAPDGTEVWEDYCPNCNYDFDGSEPKYCPNCGQRMRWSDDNEYDE